MIGIGKLKGVEKLLLWWRQRPPREQRALRWGAIVLVPVIGVFGLWLPVNDRIRTLSKMSISLERQALEVRAMQSWMQTQGLPVAGGQAALQSELPAQVEAELRATLPEFKGKVQASDGGVELVIEAVPFDRLLAWMGPMGKSEGLFPFEVQLAATQEAGVVGGRVRLLKVAP